MKQVHSEGTPGFRGPQGGAALLACGTALLLAACGARSKQPDLILVTLDTTRADHVGCYGGASNATPNLDALAAGGFLFERAVTPVPVTLPAHTTMLTGQLPPRHGVRNNGSYHLPIEATTLAERCADSGYETGAFVSAFVLDRQFGLSQGFAAYDDSLYNERPSAETVRRAIRWLKGRASERPVFLWVHLYDAHAPWTPAPPFSHLPLPSPYDQEIAADDAALGTLIAELKRSKRWDNTVLAVLADHGEGLGDHGETEHGIFLYQETTRIPFVLKLPKGMAKRMPARKVSTLVSTIDLLPTLLELTGQKPSENLDGKSLAPLLAGKSEEESGLDRHGVYLETLYPKENFGWAPLFAFQTEEWKWIRAPRAELYRLAADPGEKSNLVDTEAEQGATLDRRLERLLQTLPTTNATASSAVSPEVEERLRSLGYLSGGSLTANATENLPDPKLLIASHGDFDEAKRAMDDQRFADAVEPFRRVLAREERNTVATLGLGIAEVKTSDFRAAEVTLRRAIELSPGNATAQAALADALFGQERWQDALDLYRVAARDRTSARHSDARIALCLLMLGRNDELDAALRSAEARTSERAFFVDLGGRIAAWRAVASSAGPDSLALRRARAAAGARPGRRSRSGS
ncbi:MAG: sulfatase [Candidatus Eisenbacteria bacterium]